jgi:starch phosphorylase
MKAAANGALNLSILDGWWDEAYSLETGSTGWAIGGGEEYGDDDHERQDRIEADALFDVLERDVIPTFYERDRSGLPREWIRRSKSCLKLLARQFNTNRMLIEYAEGMYLPAVDMSRRLGAEGFAGAKRLAAWRRRLNEAWGQIAIDSVRITEAIEEGKAEPSASTEAPAPSRGLGESRDRLVAGQQLVVDIQVRLGPLAPDEVAVELYHGALNARDQITDGLAVGASHVNGNDGQHTFRASIECDTCGRRGFAARIIPRHEDLLHPFMGNTVIWNRS